MKYLLCLTLVSLFLLNGCTETAKLEVEPSDPIVGVWQSTGDKTWQFVLDEDGSVSEVLHPNGLHMILSEGGQKTDISEDISEHYIYGEFKWTYDKVKETLDVSMSYEKITIKTGGGKLQRVLTEQFSGLLSKDRNEWTPEWIRKTKFSLPVPERISEGVPYQFIKVKVK